MCQIPDGGMEKRPENCSVNGGRSDNTWRTEVNRQLVLILERVDRLGYAIGSVDTRVANIEGQIYCKGHAVGEDGRFVELATTLVWRLGVQLLRHPTPPVVNSA